MAAAFEGRTPSPVYDCRRLPCTRSNEMCSCAHLEERAASECWPRDDSRRSDQDDLDKIVSTDGLDVHQSLPEMQRNSGDSQPTYTRAKAMLHELIHDLPDTQRNIIHHQNTPINPTSSTSSNSKGCSSRDTQTDEYLATHQNVFLPGSPTQIVDAEQDLTIIILQPESPLSETQRNEHSETNLDTRFKGFLESYLPDTQPNTPEWTSCTPSSMTLPQIQHSLNSDVAQNNDSSKATDSNGNPHLQHDFTQSQSSTNLTDTQSSLADNPELPNIADTAFLRSGTGTKSLQTLPKVPYNKVNCRERKRIIVSSSRPAALTKAMCQWVDKTNYLLDPFREDDDCWFHPLPPPAHVSINGIARPCGKLQKRFNWTDRHGKHSLVLNFGIACKLVNYKMTKQQKDGFINKQWHLSHLCGNWTCLNPAHTTIEPGNVNISRNNCFSHRSGCLHNPQCMKDKKVPLGADGKLVDHSASMASSYAPNDGDDWDDWSVQGFDDGDEFSMVDENNESEVTGYKGDEESFIIVDEVDDEL